MKEYKAQGYLRAWSDDRFDDLSKMAVELLECRSKVENLIKTALNFDELNRGFAKLIQGSTASPSDELALSLSQCFMNDFSSSHPEQIGIYAAWQETINHRKEAVV